ncbi:PEP-CTERM sorting domain-containing protein [Undibacterium sp.]|uniref:PEP-CTERM sorting domain-containing protein n=1 Tax=Undibacterium sp. TaxID=1914977 RepID=UPI00374DC052
MNFLKKAFFGAAAALTLAGSAIAGPVNVGGVMWDPDSLVDFKGTSATIIQNIAADGSLSGFGVITTLNNTGVGVFCPGCELTFQFGGYTPVSAQGIPTTGDPAGTAINYTGGWLKIYVDHTPDADPADPTTLTAANAADGVLWLDLAGHLTNGVSLIGTNNFNTDNAALAGSGKFDVVGGLAALNFSTHTQPDGADLTFTSTFTDFPVVVGGVPVTSTGAATFKGNSIPEPGSMALVGLGLLAAGAMRRRQASK